MDSTDDDFGDLYVDVKVQASDTFAGQESECATNSGKDMGFQGTVKPDSEGEMNNLGVVAKDSSLCIDACPANLTQANEEDSEYSDSEDDLNIVLKDDDSTLARVSNTNNGVEASKTCSFQRRRTRNWCTIPNGGMLNGRMTMDASAYNACIDPSLRMPQYGCSFSHTWSRTTFDVNFDVFEKKPWMNPSADISDFFNFGFHEQSWKDYCKPLGRAIEVGGGTLERIPSADLHRPRDSDPDVVIQIPVTNDVEELSSMAPVKARSLTSDEASGSEDSHSNKGNGLNSVDDSIKDKAFVGCQDENSERFSGQQSPPTENFCSREVTPCDKVMIDGEKEEDFCNSDKAESSSVERESSLGDRIRLSPTSSCSVGKNEASDDYETESLKDSATDDQRKISTPPRRARLAEHEAISIKRGEITDSMHSRHRRSHEDSGQRHCGRAGYDVHGSIKHRIIKDASPTPDRVRGKKVSCRFGSLYRDSNKNWQHGPLITLEGDETEGKGVHYSNREKCHGRLYSSVDHARQREHRFDWRNNKESSLGRGFDNAISYKFEARRKEYTSPSSFNPSQRNFRSSFKEEDDRYGWHPFERKYGHERSPARAYENSKERNGYGWLRELYYEDCKPITDMDYRYRSEYSSAHEIHNLKQSPENDLSCRRRGNYDYNLHRRRYEDGCHRAESNIPYEVDYREMHAFAEVGRREYQGYKRHEEFSERDKRHHYTHDWHLDRFVSEKDGCKYRTQDAWPSPSVSLRDSWYTKEAKGDFWGYDTRDFRTAEAYDSQNNQLYEAASRDGWTQNLGHNESKKDILKYDDDDDWVRRNRGRCKLADDIQCSRRKVSHSENPSYTNKLLVRDIRIPIHNRMSTEQRSGYSKSHIHEPDERHHKSKKLRGDGNAFIRCQDPADLIGRGRKLSNQSKKGFSNGEDTKEQQDGQKPRKLMCRREEKAMEIQDINDKEEGEIIEEAWNVKGVEIDNERIQTSLKKMEKRRERFKETELARTGEATFESQTEQRAKIDVTNQQRPVRKRRWCGARGEATFESQTEQRAKPDVTNQQRPVRKRRWCAAS